MQGLLHTLATWFAATQALCISRVVHLHLSPLPHIVVMSVQSATPTRQSPWRPERRFIPLAVCLLIVAVADACTNYMVTAGASDDSSTHVAYNSDG